MSRRSLFAAIFLLAAPTLALAQEAPLLSSQLDYADPASRDARITCKAGDRELQAGKSVGEVFGADWPVQPVPLSAGAGTGARETKPGRLVWPRGMEGKKGLVVVAVLVGADGKPLRAEPLCATVVGFDTAAARVAMSGKFEPAVINGQPVTSVAVQVLSFDGRLKRKSTPVGEGIGKE